MPVRVSRLRSCRQAMLLASLLSLLTAAGLLAPSAHALSLGGFKNSLVTFLLKKISVPGQFEVAADEVKSPADGFSSLKGLRISDAGGVWFRAEKLSFAWSVSRLLLGRVKIDSIDIEGGHLERLPQVESGQDKSPPATPSAGWPRSPIALNIPKISVTSMRVSEAVLAQAVTFDATGSLRDEGDVQSVRLAVKRVDSVAGSIELFFRKRFDDDRIDLKLAVNEAPGGLVASAAALPADVAALLELNGSGTPAQWDGGLDLTIDGVLAAQGTLAASWSQRIGVNLAGTVTPGARLAPSVRLAIGEQADFEMLLRENDNGLVEVKQARIDARALQVAASGSFDRSRSLLDLAMDVSVERDGAQRLSPLLRPLSFEAATLRVTATGPVDAPLISGRGELLALTAGGFAARKADVVFDLPIADGAASRLNLVVASPSGPSASYSKLLGPRLSVEFLGRRHGESITIDTARFSSAAVQATASGQLGIATPIGLDLAYTMSVHDIAALAALSDIAASGSLHAKGSLSGPLTELTSAGQVSLSRAVLNDQRLGQVDIVHSARIDEQIAGSARLKMDSEDFGAGSASGAFRVHAQSVALKDLRVDLLGIKASGSLSMPARAHFPSGELDFTVASLQPIGRLSGRQLSGRGRGHAQFTARAGGASVVKAEFTDLRIDELSLQRLHVDGEATDLGASSPTVSLRMDAEGFADSRDTRVEQVSLTAAGALTALELNANLSGTHDGRPLMATLRATAALDKKVKTLRVDTLHASYDGELMQLLQPTNISVSSQLLQVEAFELSLPDEGRVRGWFKQLPAAASVNLELAEVPMRLLKVLAAVPIGAGRLSGTVTGDTGRAAPTLDARLAVTGLHLDDAPVDTGDLAAELIAGWDGRTLSAELSISGPFDPAVKARFRVPMTLAAPLAEGNASATKGLRAGASRSSLPVLDFDSAIDARLDWRGEVEALLALLPLPDHLLAGTATVALHVGGTLNAPLPSGTLTLRKGRYENLLTGTIINDISLDSDFSDQQRVQFSLRADDGERGQLQVTGLWRPGSANELFDISVRLEQMLIVRLDAATVLGSAKLSIKSNATALDVKGDVVIEQAEIRLLNPLPPSIIDLGEVQISGQSSADDASRKREPGVPILLDIGVELPGQTFVRGRGLDSEWGGALRISGTASEPSIVGRIESRRGLLDFIGRAFDLQHGRIVFATKDTVDPNLDLRLVREANGITGNIIIEGTASRPSLRFTSNPSLPASEVLPRILFGRSRQSLSAPEAVQLAAGVAALASGEESVVDEARKAIGVDVLRIESPEEGSDGAGALSVGRYATEKVYVGAKQSLDGQRSSVVLEIKLPKSFVLDTEIGQEADGSVGITWRRNF